MRLQTSMGVTVLLLCVCLPAAAQEQKTATEQKAAKAQKPISVTGNLERMMAIGAETTGWSIQLDSEKTIEGKPVKSVEIDYKGPKKLEDLKDKRVKASGKIARRHGVETGDRIVLEVSSIREVAKPSQNMY